MTLHLSQSWAAAPEGTGGTMTLTLHNLGAKAIQATTFCYTSLARIDEGTKVSGGTVTRNVGSFVEIVPDGPIPEQGTWRLRLTGLAYGVKTRSQGVLSAWITGKDGSVVKASVEDIQSLDGAPRGSGKVWPEGEVSVPLGLLPWPADVSVSEWENTAPSLCPLQEADKAPFQTIIALHRRLFPSAPAPLSLSHGRPVALCDGADVPEAGYRLDCTAERITLRHNGGAGAQYGLIALAQIAQAANTDTRFRFPKSGNITDAPRFAWRGVMLDVARNFHSIATHLRLLDIMAWMRMNRFHWHLVDDEGWRLPSRAYPALNQVGATRKPGAPIPPQYRDGPTGQSGCFTADDIALVIAHARTLGIEVMPEIEMPGHAASLLAAIPGLRDPNEPNGTYRSIQGFTNNALNPGVPLSYDVAQTLLDEAIAMFPFATIHVGADEVETRAWQKSPLAQAFAAKHGLKDTHELQAHFLRQIHRHLGNRGRRIAAWDEAAEGGGIAPENALLFAWRTKEKTAELIARGYDVVATPGQAYYLDMIEFEGWDAHGISWAGVSTPQACYELDVADGLPEGPGRLLGVQAAIWSEYLDTTRRINDIAFPRMAAVAEAGWTSADAKSWPRFAALSRGMPQL